MTASSGETPLRIVIADDQIAVRDGLATVGTSSSLGEPRRTARLHLQPLPDGLTAPGGRVLDLVEQDLTNSQIGRSLFLSAHTVKTHINRIFTKTGSANRAEAIEYVRRHLGHDAP